MRIFTIVLLILALCGPAGAGKDFKVFISADMEGVSMVADHKSLTERGREYDLNCRLMTEEVNAAVQGALDAGATHVVVRDGHYIGMNIVPDQLHPKAHLIRGDSGGPLNMMEGIDKTFDAVLYVGYHTRAGHPEGWAAHTMWGSKFVHVRVNGKKMSEAGINALTAGYFGVPVALVTGDEALCKEVRRIVGPVECAVVKKGIGRATQNVPIQEARSVIHRKTVQALKRIKEFKPYRIKPPYTVEIAFTYPDDAHHVAQHPGTRRTSERAVAYSHNNLIEALKFLTNSIFMILGAGE